MRLVFLIFLLPISCFTEDLQSPEDFSNENLVIAPSSNSKTIFHKISDEAVYLGIGATFGASHNFTQLGWAVCQLLPCASTVGNEFSLLSQLFVSVTEHAFAQTFKKNSIDRDFQFSWDINQKILSQIPADSIEDKELLHFLQERWLAKTAGFSSSAIHWIYPCFGFCVQIHPFTNHSYARIITSPSKTYKNRMEAWKQSLPHPHYFPLILTRPANIQDYLPIDLEIAPHEKIRSTAQRLSRLLQTDKEKIVIDVSNLFSEKPKEWLSFWNTYSDMLAQACKRYKSDPTRIIWIQRIQQKNIGGIRLLHFTGQSLEELEQQHQFLLDWVSRFGLTANRVELDRWPDSTNPSVEKTDLSLIRKFPSKEDFISTLNLFEQKWKTGPIHKTLMLQGTLQVLKGLFTRISEDKWREIANHPTRSYIARISIEKIKNQLNLLAQKEPESLFFETTSRLEQIHADLSALLEIFAPFISDDFSEIYRNLLSIPPDLKPLTTCGIHSTAMTSLAGILKAVKNTAEKQPHVLYGENTYFENIPAAKKVAFALSINEATEEDWKKADLLLAHFNPVLKVGIHDGYKVEKIAEILHQCLKMRETPLTLALDCTIDFIDSQRVTKLLYEFQKEIKEGSLNIIGYRSGNKFDLFGMDNYCGAPFFMIHNQDPKWKFFDSLSTDPVLQTDRLSLNWFCLAYQYAAPQLELYRAQIFKNTRALLNKTPPRLLNNRTVDYQVPPFDQEADPAFIDIKIAGPLHTIRGSALVGGTFYIKSLEAGQPIFNRPSLGFYHPNLTMIFDKENTTIRLTLGLDPAQVNVFAKCLEKIDALNGNKD